MRYELPERILHDGSEALPVDDDRLGEIVASLREEGIEAVGVGLLHSHINPGHEHRQAEVLRRALPETTVCLSSDMSREEGEYERFSTCVMNAYVQPVMTNYLKKVDDALSKASIEAPLYVMKSNGGVTSARDAGGSLRTYYSFRSAGGCRGRRGNREGGSTGQTSSPPTWGEPVSTWR